MFFSIVGRAVGVFTLILGLSLSPSLSAAPLLAGDMNSDGSFTPDDLVRVVNNASGPSPEVGLAALLADANSDGVFDTADGATVAEIIIGLIPPHAPTGEGAITTSVSYQPLTPTTGITARMARPAAVSYQPLTPTTGVTAHMARPAAVSYQPLTPTTGIIGQMARPAAASYQSLFQRFGGAHARSYGSPSYFNTP